jgi:hypothetical protein
MVFAVNPTTSQTFDAFKAKAMGKTSTTQSASASPSTPATGYGSNGAKNSIQKLTAGLAGVVFLVKLLM